MKNQDNEIVSSGSFAMLARAKVLEAQGKKIIHFEIGQPDFKTPRNIVEAAQRALNEGKTGYTETMGIEKLRQAIADYLCSSRLVNISENQIVVTPGSKTAIYLVMAALLSPGDEVIYPDPGFSSYGIISDFFGAVRKPVPLLEENGFGLDISAFQKSFSPKTRLVILNSPSNPTGGTIPDKDLREIMALVLDNPNCFVLSDEIYSQILYDNASHYSICKYDGKLERTFLVDGFSKTYSMTGWRVGYLSFPSQFSKKIEVLATHIYSCAAQFTQYAALEALTGPQDEVKSMVREFAERRDIVVGGLNSISGIKCHRPAGAFYVFPNFRSFGKTSDELAEYFLEKAGVALLSGTAFGQNGEGYLRLSYANSKDNIKLGLERIAIALRELDK